jgi:hypothetical protein
MEREPQLEDRVTFPDGKGVIVARSQTGRGWYIGVTADKDGSLWRGPAADVELLAAAGEEALTGAAARQKKGAP